MFGELTEKFGTIFKKLTGKGKLSEENIKEALGEVRRALLEADVNYKVVKDFLTEVEAKALGAEVQASIQPGQFFVKIVYDSLVELLGRKAEPLKTAGAPPTLVMAVGLQGSGKTTFCGKLALHYKTKGKQVWLAACDTQRPAAKEQLKVLGDSIGVAVHLAADDAVKGAIDARQLAAEDGADYLIVDTAGRLHIDEPLMDELAKMKKQLKPTEILLVLDAMTGQDAVNVATQFQQKLGIDGLILTKLDGDARGGAALSVRKVTGVPIKLAGVGEKLADLEPFHPDRMASRILGMGDIVGLVETAQKAFSQKQADELAERLRKKSFTLEDFRQQILEVKKMGPLDSLASKLPAGMTRGLEGGFDENGMKHTEAILSSMTPSERERPHIIDGSRRKRIAKGSGTSVQEVNQMLRQFENVAKMMKSVSRMGKFKADLLGRLGRF